MNREEKAKLAGDAEFMAEMTNEAEFQAAMEAGRQEWAERNGFRVDLPGGGVGYLMKPEGHG